MLRPALAATLLLCACAGRQELPEGVAEDAAVGRCSAGIDRARACGEWREAVQGCDGDADSHTSFPELSDSGCYVAVHYDGPLPRAAAFPKNCGYPQDRARTVGHLEREAAKLEAIADGNAASLPFSLDCQLPSDALRPAARSNARTLRALARRLGRGEERHAYAMASTFGYGHPVMSSSALVSWRPGDACVPLDKREMGYLGINIIRAARASAAYHGDVAPVVSFSGSAVHASLYEAFMQMHLAICQFDVPADAVLVDPCADHTHTNIRNTGSLLKSLGARTAYIVTDDGIQASYLQDFHSFWLVGGEIDQRALRDWGYLLGSWHQASVGMHAGFWFTPYRFWDEPSPGLGDFSCIR